MKISISYSAHSKHLKKMAEIIFMKLYDLVKYLGTHGDLAEENDMLFVGFYTDKSVCDPDTKLFLKKLKHKKIFLFGISGRDDKEYYETALKNTATYLAPSNRIIGTFMCQGTVSQKIIDRYKVKVQENPYDESLIYQYNMMRSSIGHPDKKDIDNLLIALRQWQEKYENISE